MVENIWIFIILWIIQHFEIKEIWYGLGLKMTNWEFKKKKLRKVKEEREREKNYKLRKENSSHGNYICILFNNKNNMNWKKM